MALSSCQRSIQTQTPGGFVGGFLLGASMHLMLGNHRLFQAGKMAPFLGGCVIHIIFGG